MPDAEQRWLISKLIGPKKRWRAYKARVRQLPESHRSAVGAVERYLMISGGISKGDILMSMLEDLADLFEQAAADGTPIHAVVGEDPVEFVETFLQNYSEGQWTNKEKERLIKAMEKTNDDQAAKEERAD